jgi:GxxExxY protein
MKGGGEVVYPKLSYQIIGAVFEVFNDLGFGYQEKVYQKALEKAFSEIDIKFIAQSPYKVCYKGETVGRYYIDFIVENKIVIEIKQGNYFSKKYFNQVLAYLKVSKLKLGLLINFTSSGVKFKRLLNINN